MRSVFTFLSVKLHAAHQRIIDVAGVLHVVLVELGPASTAFVCNVSEKGDRIHRCMHTQASDACIPVLSAST